MLESKIVKRVHELMLDNSSFDKAIDATCGNGYDVLFLANHYKEVIGIDIQALAIKRTKAKTLDLSNVKLYQDDFNNITNYGMSNLIVFNLGFLPGSDRKVKTQDYTSNEAILKAYSILDGIMLVACYVQHEGGYKEFTNLLNSLKENNINYILEDDFENKEKLIIIKRVQN